MGGAVGALAPPKPPLRRVGGVIRGAVGARLRMQKWAIKRIDKLRRNFLWKGSTEANGGHCLVKWAKSMRPKRFGGLGILDLDLFSRALCQTQDSGTAYRHRMF